jgi:hypothetical protein
MIENTGKDQKMKLSKKKRLFPLNTEEIFWKLLFQKLKEFIKKNTYALAVSWQLIPI